MVSFFVHNWHYLPLVEPVLKRLREQGEPFGVFVLRTPDEAYHVQAAKWRTRVPELVCFGSRASLFLRIMARVPLAGPLVAARFVVWWAGRRLREAKSQLVVVTDDRAIFYPLATLAAARAQSLSVLLYPVETTMFVESMLKDKAALPARGVLGRLARTWVRYAYPANVRAVAGVEAHFYLPRQVLPFMFWRSLLPADPWVRGSHAALSVLAVNSELQRAENEREGVLTCTEVTGFPAHDALVLSAPAREAVRSRLAQELGIARQTPLLVFFGTHFTGEFPNERMPAIHQELYQMLAAVSEHTPKPYAVVLKLHPKNRREEWLGFVKDKRIVVLDGEWDTYALAAAADATLMFTSSVALAAVATDAPLLAYELHFPSFESFYKPYASAVRLYSPQELGAALRGLAPLSAGMHAKRLNDRRTLGMFDGNSTTRVVQLIGRMRTPQ